MDDTVKAATRGRSVKLPVEFWDEIDEAARLLTERMRFPVSATDIIRAGTARHVQEILAAGGEATTPTEVSA